MPATVLPFRACREGIYAILEAALPGQPARNIGVYLVDAASGKHWIRMLSAHEFPDSEDAEVLEALATVAGGEELPADW